MNLEQLKPILINFDTLKKGDKLYHSALGEVEVNGLNNDILYPIEIIYYNDFVGGFTVLNFMKDGTFSHDCKNPSLFTENPFEYIIKGLKHPAKGRDEWIEVKSEKDLPTKFTECHIYAGNVVKYATYFPSFKEFRTAANDIYSFDKATHYQPLHKPNPPKIKI